MDSSRRSSPVVFASSLCTHLDRDRLIRLAVVGDALEQVAADPGDDALLVAVRLPHHRVRLAGARLAVGEDADVVACAGGTANRHTEDVCGAASCDRQCISIILLL